MCNTLRWGLASLAALTVTAAWAQDGDNASIWRPAKLAVDVKSNPVAPWLEHYSTFRVNPVELQATLANAPLQGVGQFNLFTVIDLPMPDGSVRKFRVCEAPIMSEQLAKRIAVRTYKVQSILNPSVNGRIDFGPNGFHGFVRSTNGESFVIEPVKRGDKTGVFSYFRKDNWSPRNFRCFTQDFGAPRIAGLGPIGFGILAAGDTIKKYRLAMNATGEYTTFHGGETSANAAVVTSINRQNSVYEIDVAVHFDLVYNKCFTDAATDPYTNDDGFAMLQENQDETDASVGDANYDMGHVFSTGGGGVARLNSVGVTGIKAQGVTGLPTPVGDDFDIDFVAHEMGHQFGGRHTFNGTTGACGGSRDTPAAYEPGSGTTIMAYAGICGNEDVQPHSDPYFHLDSCERITEWRNDPQSGGTSVDTGNRTPTANAGADYTIPLQTPFKLTGAGTDPDGDPITYCWEQFDLGTATPTSDNTTRPLFRSYNPTTLASRVFPRVQDLAAGTANPYEFLPDQARNMKFRVTVRDNHPGSGGYAFDEMSITVSGAPFKVSEPTTNVTWVGNSTQTVTWDPGGSTAANVNIYLSIDGGLDYVAGASLLALANTPNDGTEQIVVPNFGTTKARVIVEGAGSIFFDMSDADFTVTAVASQPPKITSISPSSAIAGGAGFTLTVNGDDFEAFSKVQWGGADRPTQFVSKTKLTATISAADILNPQVVAVKVMTGNLGSNTVNFSVNNPVPPKINSLNPTGATAGGPTFDLTVDGEGFSPGSVVQWLGANRPTQYLGTNQLKATIGASDIAFAQTVGIRVTSGGVNSNVVNFTVSNPLPVLSSITPTTKSAGSSTFTLTATGTGFVATSKIYWNGVGRSTIFVSSTKLTATIPASDVANQGTAQVKVTNPGPGGGTSSIKTFTIAPLAPASIAIQPKTITGGQNATGAVYLNGAAPPAGLTITLSKVGNAISVPATTPVGGGKYSSVFTIGSTPVGSDVVCTVKASANGVTVSNTITVLAPRPILVTLNPSSVTGGQNSTGTFTLSGPAPAGGMTVSLASGVPSIVQVPPAVFVAAGQKTKSFLVTTKPFNQQASIAVWAIYKQKGAFALLDVSP